MRVLGERVRERRLAGGLRQREFAEKHGFDRTFVSAVERGRRNLLLANVLRLAKALDVDPADLLGGLAPDGDQPQR